ncbi:hypothetical protein Trydic_g6190 [Trypoxylus dichotomus]
MNALIINFLLILCSSAFVIHGADDCPVDQKGIFCYYASWAVYRNDIGSFTVADIDPNLCTHLVYAFTGLSKDGLIGSMDPNVDLDRRGYLDFTALKEQNPCLKTLLAIGGWNQGSRRYSVMVGDKEYRKKFIDSVLRYLAEYDFDGIDLDWEYPTQRGGIAEDKENFGLLLKEMKEALARWGLTVSLAVPIDLGVTEAAYDMKAIDEYVDYVFIMGYDYTSAGDGVTGLISPLNEISKTVQLWTKSVKSTKVVLGVPAYGASYTLKSSTSNGLGAAIIGPGEPGFYTGQAGFLSYLEVQSKVRSGLYKVVPVPASQNYYAYHEDDWITFEMKENYEAQARYVLQNNLGGAMVWSIDAEDHLGSLNSSFPIINSIRNVLYG